MVSRPHQSLINVSVSAPDDFAACAVFLDGSSTDVTHAVCDLVLLGALHPSTAPLETGEIDIDSVYQLDHSLPPKPGEVLFTTSDVLCVLSSPSSPTAWNLSFDEFGKMLARGVAVLLEQTST